VGKAAAVAGAAAVATSAIRSSAAATPIVGAQHAVPAAHVSAVTRPRTEETATEVGAAAAVDQALIGKKQKVRGKKTGGKQSGLSQGAQERFRKERDKDNGDCGSSSSRLRFTSLQSDTYPTNNQTKLRARQGAARDEAKETKKGQNAIEKRETPARKRLIRQSYVVAREA
jgi:hypothetical protein